MKNLGGLDKKLRMGLGVIFIAAGLMPALVGIIPNSILHLIIVGVGLTSFVTGYFSFCPIYGLFGIKTYKIENSD